MKVFNLTDIGTPILKAKGLVGKVLVAGRVMVEPGKMVEVGEDPVTRRDLQYYVECGAMAVDVLPAAYTVAKLAKSKKLDLDDRIQANQKVSTELKAKKNEKK